MGLTRIFIHICGRGNIIISPKKMRKITKILYIFRVEYRKNANHLRHPYTSHFLHFISFFRR